MTRLHKHIAADGGKVDEQIDKFTGKQASAEHLTWSYANILHALHVRAGLGSDPTDPPGPDPTTSTTSKPGPTDQPPDCCSAVQFSSTGPIRLVVSKLVQTIKTPCSVSKPEVLGRYSLTGSDAAGNPVYSKKGQEHHVLHHVVDPPHKFEAWVVSGAAEDLQGDVANFNPTRCVESGSGDWELLEGDGWQPDSTARVECETQSDCCTSLKVLCWVPISK